ncbi:MAG TPA: imidazole glycerol phosphate synthase subunit HisH [Chloroflexota bacterium]|nr:imidazole glycerol phosphate synthase subunit HisH [Chloroflexota bacterium]
MIAVVDYDAGNLRSISHGLRLAGAQVTITSDPAVVQAATAVVVPGVGAASDTMASLRSHGLERVIADTVRGGKPYLGVCMGLQVLLTYSEEGGRHPCLDVFPGVVARLPDGVKVPHMGWNQILHDGKHPLLAGIPNAANVYFVHSYYAAPTDAGCVIGRTEYGISFPSVLARDNLMATQFHPEKSGRWGLALLRNFVQLAGEAT